MKVRDAMTIAPATCGATTAIRVVAQLMADHDCAAVPITDSGRLIGIVTDRDIACRAVAYLERAADQPVEAVMTFPVITITDEASLDEAVALMEQNTIHHLPVIRGDGQVIGMLAQSDVGRRLTNREFGRMARSTSIRCWPVYKRPAALVRKEC